MHTCPLPDSVAIAVFATIWPATKFTVDAVGRRGVQGKAVRKPPSDGSTATTLNTAAVAPTGTPARPATCTATWRPAGIRSEPPSPLRVSSSRAGTTEMKLEVVGAAGGAGGTGDTGGTEPTGVSPTTSSKYAPIEP